MYVSANIAVKKMKSKEDFKMATANCGGLLIDNSTIVVDATTKALKVASGTVLAPDATTTTKGIVLQSEAQADSVATTAGSVGAYLVGVVSKMTT